MDRATCIARGVMPQIDAADLLALRDFLEDAGVTVEDVVLEPRAIRGRQKVDRAKVRGIPDAALDKPLLVSREPLILDGNHRWLAAVYRKRASVDAWRLVLPFNEALQAIFKFPRTYYYADGAAHPITF